VVKFFADWLFSLGMENLNIVFANIITGTIIVALAFLSKFLFEKVVIKPIEHFIKKSPNKWDDILVRHHVLGRISLMIPAIVIVSFAPVFPMVEELIKRLSTAYLIFIAAVVMDAILEAITDAYQFLEISRDKPIKS